MSTVYVRKDYVSRTFGIYRRKHGIFFEVVVRVLKYQTYMNAVLR